MLDIGSQAPTFSLLDQDQATVTLADQAGTWVVMWWYPKASTPG